MHVQLDEELWEMSDSVRLEEVLARISDTAHAKGRLVTDLKVGNQSFTDRDLLPGVLSQPAGTFAKVVATSQAVQTIVNNGAQSAKELGASLKSDGEQLVQAIRRGETQLRSIDEWFGRLADYVEWAEIARSLHASQAPVDSLARWLQETLEARDGGDMVRLADALEFEVIPRLPSEIS